MKYAQIDLEDHIRVAQIGQGQTIQIEQSSPGAPSAWRTWSEAASPELKAYFDAEMMSSVSKAKHRYPSGMARCDPAYRQMKEECTRELDLLALRIEEEYAHVTHD